MNQFELFDSSNNEGKFYKGSFSSEFEGHFLEILHLKAQQSLQRHILVPTNLSGLYLKKAYSQKYGQYAGLNFLTFVDLAQASLLHIEKITSKPLFKISCEALWLKEILDEQSILEFTQSNNAQSSPSGGFYDQLISSFHKLMEEGIISWSSSNDRQNALKKAYTHYQSQILQKQHCPSSLIFEASYKSQKLLNSFSQHMPQLFVYGFSRLTNTQQQLLKNISVQSDLHMWIDEETFRYNPQFSFHQSLPVQKILPVQKNVSENSSFLNTHADVYAEAKWIRQNISDLIQKDPSCFIGIAIKDYQTYSPLIYETLKEDSSIHIFDAKDPSAEGSFLMRSFQSCIDYLKSARRIEDFYKLLFDFPFKDEFYKSHGPIGKWIDVLNQSLHLQSHQIHSQRLFNFAQSSGAQNSNIVALSKDLQSFLNALEKLHQATESWQKCFKNWTSLYTHFSQPSPQTHASFEHLFNIVEMDSTDISPSWENTSSVILKQLKTLHLRPYKFKDAQVVLLPVSQCKAFRFDHLFIPGFNNHHFPQLQTKDPVLWDTQKERLNQSLNIELVSSKIHLELEQLDFRELCQSSNQNIFLSYSLQGIKDGHEYKASSYGKSHFPQLMTYENVTLQKRNAVSYLEFQKELANAPIDLNHMPHMKHIQDWGTNHFESTFWNAFDGVIDPQSDPQYINKHVEKSFSASSLQDLASCPYRYYLKYVLKIKGPQELDKLEQLRALDRGLLVHEILFSFYMQKKNEHALPLKKLSEADYLRDLQQCSHAVFKKRSLEIPTRNHHIWALEQEKINRDVQRLLLHDLHQQYHQQALAFEVRFGMPARDSLEDGQYSQDAAIQIESNEHQFKIHGKIDRIDASADKQQFTVIDYKTGKLQSSMSHKIKGGQNLQMPLYILAAQDLLGKESSLGQAKLLSFNFESEHSEVYFSGSILEERKCELLTLLDKLQSHIRSGQFIPHPGKGAINCSYCDYKNLCGDHVHIRSQRRSQTELSMAFSQLEKDHP